jgi:hypothetical protein
MNGHEISPRAVHFDTTIVNVYGEYRTEKFRRGNVKSPNPPLAKGAGDFYLFVVNRRVIKAS